MAICPWLLDGVWGLKLVHQWFVVGDQISRSPNPTVLQFSTKEQCYVMLSVRNILGRLTSAGYLLILQLQIHHLLRTFSEDSLPIYCWKRLRMVPVPAASGQDVVHAQGMPFHHVPLPSATHGSPCPTMRACTLLSGRTVGCNPPAL